MSVKYKLLYRTPIFDEIIQKGSGATIDFLRIDTVARNNSINSKHTNSIIILQLNSILNFELLTAIENLYINNMRTKLRMHYVQHLQTEG